MTGNSELIELQNRQEEHDRNHHRDIYNLAYPARMNHYVLHFSKYVGRLSRNYPEGDVLENQMEKTLADSFIVALAAANTLNLDLRGELEEMFGSEAESAQHWAENLNATEDDMDLEETQDWLFRRLATPTGRMANALESLDHMESVDTRQVLEEDTVEIVTNLLIAFAILERDIDTIVGERWEEIEKESIL